jgi:hypothetical protein
MILLTTSSLFTPLTQQLLPIFLGMLTQAMLQQNIDPNLKTKLVPIFKKKRLLAAFSF